MLNRIDELIKQMTVEEKVAQLSCNMPLAYLKNESVCMDKVARDFPNGIGRMTQVATGFFSGPEVIAKALHELQHYAVEQTRLGIPILFQLETLTGVNACKATIFPSPLSVASTFDEGLNYEIGSIIQEQMQAIGAHLALSPVADVCRNAHFGRCAETYGEDSYVSTQFAKKIVEGIQSKKKVAACAKHFLGYAASETGLNAAHIPLGMKELKEVYGKPFHAMIKESNLHNIMVTYSSIDGLPVTLNKRIIKGLLKKEMQFHGLAICDATSIELSHTQQGIGCSLEDVAVLAIENEIDADTPMTKSYHTLPKAIASHKLNVKYLDAAVRRVLKEKERLGLFEDPYQQLGDIKNAFHKKNEDISRRIAEEAIILLKNKENILPLNKNQKISVIGPHSDKVMYLIGGYSYPTTIDLLLSTVRGEAGSMQGFMELLRTIVNKDDLMKTLEFDENKSNLEMLEDYAKKTYHSKTLFEAIKEKNYTQVMQADGCELVHWNKELFLDAYVKAEQSDIIILTLGGLNGFGKEATSGENKARCDLDIPLAQVRLVKKLAKLKKPMILVLINGRPLSLSNIEPYVDTILELWINGSHGSEAAANVIFGEVNPSGRLPMSLPRHSGQTPLCYSDYAGSGYKKLNSAHNIGEFSDIENLPLYPFGFGLSYSKFIYEKCNISQDEENIYIQVNVKNNSLVDGKEVVQVYMHKENASIIRPTLELVAYKKTDIPAKKVCCLRFTISRYQLGYFNINDKFVLEEGNITFYVGKNADELLWEEQIYLEEIDDFYQNQIFSSKVDIKKEI